MKKSIKDFILTLKKYTEYQQHNIGDGFLDEVAAVSILTGIEPNKLKNDEFDKVRSELALQTVASEPVYMLRWKGKTYGYHPAEIETIGDVVELATICKMQKWNLLAAFMFREVNYVSEKVHSGSKGWKKFHNVDVKFINNFHSNFAQYGCKKIENWSKVDTTIWDDFPFEILSSNLNFSLGNGMNLNLNIHASSLKLKENQKNLGLSLQILMASMASYLTCLKTQETSHKISDTNQLTVSHHDNSLTFLREKSSKELLKNMASQAWIFSGSDETEKIYNYCLFACSLYLEPEIMPAEFRYFSTLSDALLKQTKQQTKIKDVIHG